MNKIIRNELIKEKQNVEKEIDELIRQIWVKKQLIKILDDKIAELNKAIDKPENVEKLPYIQKK